MTDEQPPLKVVLGAGPQPIHPCHLRFIDSTWKLTDLHPEGGGIERVDAKALPWQSDTVDAIYASHLLEHFARHEIDAVLCEWARVLKPGAPIHLLVPDATWAFGHLLLGDANSEALALDVFYNRDLDGMRDCHRMCFTLDTLRRHFQSYFVITDSGVDYEDAHHVRSIFVKGVKR